MKAIFDFPQNDHVPLNTVIESISIMSLSITSNMRQVDDEILLIPKDANMFKV